MPWLSGLLSLGSVATSGILSILNNKRAEEYRKLSNAQEQAYLNARANEGMNAKDRQALKLYDDRAKKQVDNVRATNVITGGTDEQVTATQNAVAQGRANAISNIASNVADRQDKYKDEVMLADRRAAQQEQEAIAQRNQTYAALAGNALNAAASMADAFGGGGVKNTSANKNNTSKAVSDNKSNI